ncbi:unnamed protein product [Peronospora farinosa]|uniref:Transmembrane protein n=1 Tax=Peronospora farinosa TaxID=134698 RepID=A0ABN8BVX1_9STRA|nr:unnamed protein product [Peronospora farinosa]
MHFGVLLVLIVTTFVASCGCFICVETYALDGNTIDSTKVRRLRGDNIFEEERAFLGFSILSRGQKSIQSVEDLPAAFTAKELKRLERNNIDMEQVLEKNGKELYKLVVLAVEGDKGKMGILRRVIKFLLVSIGVGAVLYILWALTLKTQAPSASALKNVGSTTTV